MHIRILVEKKSPNVCARSCVITRIHKQHNNKRTHASTHKTYAHAFVIKCNAHSRDKRVQGAFMRLVRNAHAYKFYSNCKMLIARSVPEERSTSLRFVFEVVIDGESSSVDKSTVVVGQNDWHRKRHLICAFDR